MDQNPRDRGNLYISESWSELKLSREIIILLNLFYKKNSKESIYIYIYILDRFAFNPQSSKNGREIPIPKS